MLVFRILIITGFVFVSLFANSQKPIRFGFGIDFGYKCSTNQKGIVFHAVWNNRITISTGISSDRFTYDGINLGIDCNIWKTILKPVFGISLNRMSKSEFSTGDGDRPNTYSRYYIPWSLNGVVYFGVQRNIFGEDPRELGVPTFTFYISYRESISHPEVQLVEGVYKQGEIIKINNSLKSGLGIGLRISFTPERWLRKAGYHHKPTR